MDPINRYGYSYSFLYQFDTKQDCLMLTVPKLLVVGLVLKTVQTEMSLADEQWPLSSIIYQLYSDWAQLMQITNMVGPIGLKNSPPETYCMLIGQQ